MCQERQSRRAKFSDQQTRHDEVHNECLKQSNPEHHVDPCSSNEYNIKLHFVFLITSVPTC